MISQRNCGFSFTVLCSKCILWETRNCI